MALVTPDAAAATSVTRTANQGILLQNGTDKTLKANVTIGTGIDFTRVMEPGTVAYVDGIAAVTAASVSVSTLHVTGIDIDGVFRATAAAD